MAGKKKHFSFSTMHLSDIPKVIIALFKGQLGAEEPVMSEQTGFYEINLVPDIKAEMIKAQKARNLIFFICIVVSIISASTATILASIKGAQDITIGGQDSHIKNLSDKISNYSELTEFLTIQNQLNGIAEIEADQKVLSRAVGFLNSLIPESADTISVSELVVDLTSGALSFDGQANSADDIDYRTLEAFIKRTKMMTFDYGRYVDSQNNEIPSRCIEEYDQNGKLFEENGSVYAIWHRAEKGCDPDRNDFDLNEDGTLEVPVSMTNLDLESTKMENGTSDAAQVKPNPVIRPENEDEEEKEDQPNNSGDKQTKYIIPSEKIYRTPQFTAWRKGEPWKTASDGIEDDKVMPTDENVVYNITNYKYTPVMELDGSVSGIPHFKSSCITYTGEVVTEPDEDHDEVVKWSASNNCVFVSDEDGIQITESANGRDSEDNLVLTFKAIVKINPDAFAYKNKHVMPIGPNGQNVTDSYVQLEKIFAAPATECSAEDEECNSTPTGRGTER
ncbi:hypothetical protein J6X90_03455 [Candidatus Saccharibacteria bacterium]|nr:hypothetical protein [Candidatus Saccharibacteria bacterium]